jgi:purine-binding chemotaxis protein CheW
MSEELDNSALPEPGADAREAKPDEAGPSPDEAVLEVPAEELGEAAAALAEGFEAEEGEMAEEPALPQEQYCLFRAGRERFCLHVLEVDEVVDWPRLTNLPLSPSFLMGVFNLRGTIVPVVDIAFTEIRRADLPPKQVVVACLRGEAGGVDIRVGIAADEVIGTYSTSEPLLREEAPRDVPHCCGMLRHGDRLALALDLRKVLESFPVGAI